MHDAVASPLPLWEAFYVIVGTSAGALTGLQFVVMTLIGESRSAPGNKDTIAAFGSPNVVHFCAALLLSAILGAPWGGLYYAGLTVAACGVAGVVYSAVVMRRARRQSGYQPVLEDWMWHTILPLAAYLTLFVTGVLLERGAARALFVIGAAVLLLVFIGIHNAWDTVTYLTVERSRRREAEPDARGGGEVGVAPAGSSPGPSSAEP